MAKRGCWEEYILKFTHQISRIGYSSTCLFPYAAGFIDFWTFPFADSFISSAEFTSSCCRKNTSCTRECHRSGFYVHYIAESFIYLFRSNTDNKKCTLMWQIRLWEADLNRIEMTPAYLYDEFPSRVTNSTLSIHCLSCIINIMPETLFLLSSRKFSRLLVTLHESGMVYCGRNLRKCAWWSRQKSTWICENTFVVPSNSGDIICCIYIARFEMNIWLEKYSVNNLMLYFIGVLFAEVLIVSSEGQEFINT